MLVCGTTPITCFAAVGMRDDVDAADEGTPARRDHARREHARGGRLARAVGAEQPEDLTLVHLEVELVDRLQPTRVHLGELLGAHHHVVNCGHRPPPRSRCVDSRSDPFEVRADARERAAEHLDVALGEDPPELGVDVVHDVVELRRAACGPAGGDDDAQHAPVVGIGLAARPGLRRPACRGGARGSAARCASGRRARAGWRRRRWPPRGSSTQFQRLAPCSCSRRSSSSCTARWARKRRRPSVCSIAR